MGGCDWRSDCLEVHAQAAMRVDVATVHEMITESLPGAMLSNLCACKRDSLLQLPCVPCSALVTNSRAKSNHELTFTVKSDLMPQSHYTASRQSNGSGKVT